MPLLSMAQLIACRDSIKDGYDFWLYLPDDYKTEFKPVVMFLHGKSLCGNDLNQVLDYGCIHALMRGKLIDAVVIAPQARGAWKPEKVMDVFDWVNSHYRVDSNRFYVLGMSMGGFGTLDFAATYPEKVAAAMALCGGATVSSLCGLNSVPLWIVHGTADHAVPIGSSKKVVDAMAACDDTTRLIFTKLKGADHTKLARVFYIKQTYDWLFSHSLADTLRPINKEYSITNELLQTAYDDVDSSFRVKVIDGKSPNFGREDWRYYIVKQGDSLSKIAVENNTTVSILCKINKIRRNQKLWPGMKIRVK